MSHKDSFDLTREPPEPPFVQLASLSLFVPHQRQRQRQRQTQRQRQRQRQIQRRRLPNLHLCLSLSLNKDSDKDNDKRNVKDKDKYSAAVCPTCIFVSLCPSTAQWRALCCGSSSHQIIQWFLMEGDSELILPNIHWKSLQTLQSSPSPSFPSLCKLFVEKVHSWSHISMIT